MTVSIESKRRRQRRQAVLGVTMFALFQAACVICFAALCFIPDLPRWAFRLFAALAGMCGLLVVPALVVLKERFQEIEGGESDAAADY
nr:hypothetical protein [uncultured Oscillibacter sp.]